MTASSMINAAALQEHIFRTLNAEMIAAAEPMVKEVVAKFEAEFRKKLAARVLATIQSDYAVERMGQDIRITVRGFSGNG